jgi:hypothetical protein
MLQEKLEFAEANSLNVQNILFVLKENAIHWRSKPEGPSMESSPYQFRLPTDNPHRHRQQEEAVPHLHTKDSKSKALSDYAQQNLSKVTKRSPLDMQKL